MSHVPNSVAVLFSSIVQFQKLNKHLFKNYTISNNVFFRFLTYSILPVFNLLVNFHVDWCRCWNYFVEIKFVSETKITLTLFA